MNRDYSRTEFVFGREALQKMQGAAFLLIGADGLAQEVAKNLVLTGVNSLLIYDPTPASFRDLASSPFLTEAHAHQGVRLDHAILPYLQELNPQCRVQVVDPASCASLDEFLRMAALIIHTRTLPGLLLGKLGDVCHSSGVPYIICTANGLSARIFCDFGENHTVLDPDGEKCDDLTIANCTVDFAPTTTSSLGSWHFFFTTTKPHELSDGYLVHITDLKFVAISSDGQRQSMDMSPLETAANNQLWIVRVTSHSLFEAVPQSPEVASVIVNFLGALKENHNFEVMHLRGGYMKRVKEPVDIASRPYSVAAADPSFSEGMLDFSKFGRDRVLHGAYYTLDKFMEVTENAARVTSNNTIWNAEAAGALLADLIQFAANGGAADPALKVSHEVLANPDNAPLLMLLLMTFNGRLAPVASFIGGWAAQEALKYVSGKYMPIHQFYYYEAFEALPSKESAFYPTLETTRPRPGDRYEGQRIVIGDHLQRLICQSSLFVVGAGALGCELLKQFALVGACTAPEAALDLTDLDGIENSNLSRQFLFREHDIGKMKSEVAAERTKGMNPNINIRARTLRVGHETESILNSDFWESKTVIVNALDNVPTRLYVDNQCCLYRKPLLESGTMGQKANMQVVVPWLTEIYGSQRDPETGEDPACTIHNFPNTIVHCIVYATSEFKGLFDQASVDLHAITSRGLSAYISELLNNRDTVDGRLVRLQSLCAPVGPCDSLVKRACCWAALLFERYFIQTVAKILADFPPDAKDKEGNAFWSGEKRPPHPLTLMPQNEHHREFIRAAACLYTDLVGQKTDILAEQAVQIALEYLGNSSRPQVHTSEAAGKTIGNVLDGRYTPETIMAVFNDATLFDQTLFGVTSVHPITFEKDDLSNNHVQLISAFSNLRAENYEIQPVALSEVRRLSGNIIPAMITTTASIVGLVAVEFYKVLLYASPEPKDHHPIEDYKSVFLNFAIPILQFSEPGPSVPLKCSTTGEDVTPWDEIRRSGDLTVQQVIDIYSERYKCDVDGVVWGTSMIYATFGNFAANLNRTVRDLTGIKSGNVYLLVNCANAETYEDVEVPRFCLTN